MKIQQMLAGWSGLLLGAFFVTATACASEKTQSETSFLKPRIVVLTDIAPVDVEPDDMESMVRLLVHADLYEIEGLISTGGWNSSGRAYPTDWMDSLKIAINAYERDLPNLMKRSGQTGFLPADQESQKQSLGYWPSPDYLRSRTLLGSLELGVGKLGEGNDSPGSELIIRLADEEDDRPLWITVWGGANTLAQAIWRVKHDRTEEEFRKFLHKLYVYTITDQDVPWGDRGNYAFSSHQWIRKTCGKDIHFIWDESAWLTQNSTGSSNWKEYATHIQGHGNLGKIYPKNKYGVEGDTPSFLHVFPNGLNDPTIPGQVGWGGYFRWGLSLDGQTECYTNTDPTVKAVSQKYENYFYPATFASFAARMDWAAEGKGNRNPVVVVNKEKGLAPVLVSAGPGTEIRLDASGTTDPDGDAFTCHWWVLPEAGTYAGKVEILKSDDSCATLCVPEDAAGKQIHVICEVTDKGVPALKGYRRVIVQVAE